MEKKINIAEYLKDCPNGMELDCLMYENLYFDSLNSDYYGTINCYTLIDGIKTSINFTKYGTFNNHTGAKCVIFPKGKTTWDGFVPPCQFKNGDVLVSESGNIVLLSHVDSESIVHYHCIIPTFGSFRIEENTNIGVGRYYECVLANEQQKQRMYDKIKSSGYKYNQSTNKLEKLNEPKFKDGDVLAEDSCIFIIQKIGDNCNAAKTHCTLYDDGYFDDGSILYFDLDSTKLATEEEKQKLFDAIKENGYKWNEETKTLEKLVEPRFHEGDWVTDGVSKCQIRFIDNTHYWYSWYSENCILGNIESVDKQYHLWTIEDANDGDVLVTVNDGNRPFIYKGCLDPNHPDSPVAYCGIDADGYFCSGGGKFNHWWTVEKVQPSTKEQRDTLMKAMTDAGYTFDFYKKELKLLISNGGDFESNNSKQKSVEWSEEDEKRRKAILTGLIDCRDAPDLGWSNFGGISIDDCIAWLEKQVDPKFHISNEINYKLVPNKFDINTLKPYDKVLVRDGNDDVWVNTFFGFCDPVKYKTCIFVTGNENWCQCIPYDGNEHLLGTTDDCEDYFKTWQK